MFTRIVAPNVNNKHRWHLGAFLNVLAHADLTSFSINSLFIYWLDGRRE